MRAMLVISLCWLASVASGQSLQLPDKVQIYEPIVVQHESGMRVQVLPWGTSVPSFLDERYVKRFDTHTVFAAPPGAYLVAVRGELAIVIIEGAGPTPPPGPTPPGPTPPGPQPPGPTPPPGPQPDVPADEFNNVGRFVRQQLASLSQEDRQRYQQQVRDAYLNTVATANKPTTTLITLNDVSNYLQMELNKVFASGRPEGWQKLGDALRTHLATVTVTRLEFPALCQAIAEGLK